jgi:hypothetical protein
MYSSVQYVPFSAFQAEDLISVHHIGYEYTWHREDQGYQYHTHGKIIFYKEKHSKYSYIEYFLKLR